MKTPTVCRNRGFRFLFFVNQKSADFVLSVRLAPCHFLVDYSIKKSDVAFPLITTKDLPNKDGKHDEYPPKIVSVQKKIARQK
ncbi:hypothetical protein ONZ27_005343 [Salmonella enterica subsp. enterica serovar Chandans]|nr:hypothetical protein [Salmonella enterica subsp. enterica serovar Chandans]